MFNVQTSIRQKTIFGYYVGVAVIASLFIFTLVTFKLIEKKILFGEMVSELFDSTLEIRRFEKNYFLYEQESDFQKNIEYTKKAQDILERNTETYKSLAIYPMLKAMNQDLSHYRELMEQFPTLKDKDSIEKQQLEEKIRDTGKRIVTVAENISKIELEIIDVPCWILHHNQFNVVFF